MSVSERNAILNHRYGGPDYLRVGTVYLAAFLVNPTADDGSGFTEVDATGYARLAVLNNATNFPPAANGVLTNGADLEWDPAVANWGTVVGIGVFKTLTGGLPTDWFDGVLETINTTNSLRIRAGEMTLEVINIDDVP